MSIFDSKGRFIFAEVVDLFVYNIADHRLIASFDELQNSNFSFTMDKVPMNGKNGTILYNLKRAKGAQITATSGDISDGGLAWQMGSKSERLTDAEWPMAETLTVTGGQVVLTKQAIGVDGEEIKSLNIDTNPDNYLTQGSTPAADTFVYDATTNTIEFDSSIADGTVVFVRYDATAGNVKKITDYSDAFSEPARIEARTRWIDACNKKSYLVWIVMEQGDVDGNFSLEVGDNGAVQNLTIDALGGCGRTNLIDIFLADEEDIV